MEKLQPIYCKEKCPIGKKCCFGEIYVECIGNQPIRERHKCNYSKATNMNYVITEIYKPAV